MLFIYIKYSFFHPIEKFKLNVFKYFNVAQSNKKILLGKKIRIVIVKQLILCYITWIIDGYVKFSYLITKQAQEKNF